MNSYLRKGLLLGLAAAIQGFAMATFLFPHDIPSGGVASISVLFKHIWNTPISVSLFVVNVCMLLAAIKWLGTANMLWTLFCVSITAATVQIISPVVQSPVSFIVSDLLIGSIIFGIGVGILFRLGASSGGMDILALIIYKLSGSKPGRTLFIINGCILFVTSAIVDWKIIFLAILCQWISTKVIDFIFNSTLSRFSRFVKV